MREGLDNATSNVGAGRGHRLASWLFAALGGVSLLFVFALVIAMMINPGHRERNAFGMVMLPVLGAILPILFGSIVAFVASRRFTFEWSRPTFLVHLGAFVGTIVAALIGAVFGYLVTKLVISPEALMIEPVLGGMLVPFGGLVFGAAIGLTRVMFWDGLGYDVDVGRLPVVQTAIRTAGVASFVTGLLLFFAALFRGMLMTDDSQTILAYCLIASLPIFAVSAGSNAGELGRNPALKWVIRLILAYVGSLVAMFGAFIVISTLAYATSSASSLLSDWNLMIVVAPIALIMVFVMGVAITGLGAWLYFLSLRRL